MKKNIMMRISAALLVAVLLTTCVISGTFAKYVTSDSETDSAEVANWGVTVTVSGDATAVQDTTDSNTEAHIVSNVGELLAPGTKGVLGNVAISGQPEVAVQINYSAVVTLEGWEVESEYYCPVVVKINGTAVTAVDKNADSKIDASDYETCIEEAIAAYTESFAAGKDLATEANEIVITWEWEYSTSDANDVKDTALGDAAAAGNAPSIEIALTATVTQVD